jgi:hypothetical protein
VLFDTPNWAATAFALSPSSSRMRRAKITLDGVRERGRPPMAPDLARGRCFAQTKGLPAPLA